MKSNYLSVPTGGILPIGKLIKLEGRSAVITAIHPGPEGIVELVDATTRTPLSVRNPETNETSRFTLEVLRTMYADGKAVFTDEPENAAERQGRYALLDPDACEEKDPKGVWRKRLGQRAIGAGIKKTDREAAIWLDDNFGREKGDLDFPKPSPSALRRWMTKLEKAGGKTYAVVSQAGRPKGHSQLDPIVNELVHQAALFYWTRPRAQKVDAHGWLDDEVKKLAPKADGTRHATPSKQTVYKRIDELRCYDTVRAKLGEKEADRLFRGSGEALVVNDILDVVLMDATTLEQTIVFDEEWLLPACKVRIVALMCARSHAIVGWHVYAGPNRGETSIEAVIASMMPPEVDADALRSMPILAWIFGKGRSILPDNEKALIAPSTIDSFNEVGIDIVMPPTEMPTAKATLERFFRFLKQALAQLPGTIVDPKRAKEMGYDPVGPALTLAQIRRVVASVVTQHNISPSKGLDGQSPALVWERLSHTRATPMFEDVAHVRRVLGRTVTVLLTRDGVEHDGIRYRDAATVQRLLDNMGSTQAKRGQRKDGSITLEVKGRISPGNLDVMQIHDTLMEEWVDLPSTQPLYTDRLSEWEHKQFTLQAKRRNEKFSSEDQRLQSKARTMRLIDELAPKLPFQQRRDLAALYQSQQVEKLAGRAFALPASIAAVAPAQQDTVETGRADAGVRTPTKSTTKGEKRPAAPKRQPGYGGAETPKTPVKIDWDGIPLLHGANDDGSGDPDVAGEEEAA